MSNWIELTDPEAFEIDEEDINILYSEDKFGNNYVHFKKELIADLLAEQSCKGCEHLRGRFCMLSTNHCTRRGEDFYAKSKKK